jgi:hypothetical protein
MRNITQLFILLIFCVITQSVNGQILNQPANWPNGSWTLSGTYTAGGLVSNPTVAGTTFTWDDDGAGNGSADDIIATSPVIDLTAASGAGETWITVSGDFVYRALGGDVLAIETYDADTMTWSALQTFTGNSTNTDYQTCASTATYTTAVLDISSFTATQLSGFQYRVSYDDQGGWQWGWCLTSPTIVSATPPSCIDPSALTATSITASGADLGWTENASATVWDIEIVDITAAGTATGTPTFTGVTNPYTYNTGVAQNDYEFYVRADCGASGGAGVSNWVGPFAFTTACTSTAAPYTEDFETFTTAASAFTAENCWTGTGGAYYWESAPGTDTGSTGTGPSPTVTTGNYFYTEASGGVTGDVTDLVSPLVDLTALTAPALLFDYHMTGNEIGTLDIIVNGTTVFTLTGEQQLADTDPFLLATVDLAAYVGQTVQVTFRATSAGTFEGDIAIDNVSFTELPTCPAPSMLTVANITDTTVDLGWTEAGSATVWDVEIVDITAGGTATGTATATGVANPYTATGLASNNDYEFYVRAVCGGDVSTWVGPFAFSTICSTFTAPYTEDFENAGAIPACWSQNAANNWDFNLTGPNHVGNAGVITGSTASNNYYAVVDDSGATANINVLTSPFVDLTPLTTPALTFYEISDNEGQPSATLTVEVWDGAAWNTVGTYNTNTAGWELKTINLSALTFTGAAQARFTVADSGSFYDDIAIDDVSFVELPTCPQPSMLTVSNIAATTADLSWTEAGTATSWDIEIVDITAGGTFTGTPTVTGATNPYAVTGLIPQNDYAFYVRADCGGGDLSSFSGPSNFRTLCAPITSYPSTTDFTNNPPTVCWDEAVDGEVAAGPTGLGASDWRQNRAYQDINANVVNSNAINLFAGNTDREWLISPIYTIPSGTPHALKLQVAVTNYSFSGTTTTADTMGSDDEVQLLMTTDSGTTWTMLTTWNAGNQPSVNGTDYLADLTAVTGDVQFALWASDGVTNDPEDYDFHVGAFTVDLLSALSTDEFSTKGLDFSYYPNPVNSNLTINANSKVSSIQVINVLGQTVFTSTPNTKKVSVDMSSLSKGAYFVRVVSDNSTDTIRILKN